MLSSPLRVLADLVRSSWYRLFGAALFLPMLSRALLPMLPTVLILGTSSNPAMWKYQWYYPLALIPFVFWGLIEAHRFLPILRERPPLREGLFLGALLLFPLLGAGYMRFPIPSLDQLRAIPALQARLLETPEVCAQEAIMPRVPYPVAVHRISSQCLQHPGANCGRQPWVGPVPVLGGAGPGVDRRGARPRRGGGPGGRVLRAPGPAPGERPDALSGSDPRW